MKRDELLFTKESVRGVGAEVTTALLGCTLWLTLSKFDHDKNSLCLEGTSDFANYLRVRNVSRVIKLVSLLRNHGP